MLGNHSRAILQFSGGKDSLAALYLARPYLDKITVMFCDTGATFPHVLSFVKETCAKLGADLQIVRPFMPVAEYTERFGLPSDVVPAWATYDVAPFLKEKPAQLIQPVMACCSKMLFEPVYRAVLESGIKLVIRGAKSADRRVGVPPGHIDANGIEYVSPVWDWSDDQVFNYLKTEGVNLPDHYEKAPDSLDCWLCTAHMPYGPAAAKLKYTKDNYPDLWPAVQDRLQRVRHAVSDATKDVARATDAFLEA